MQDLFSISARTITLQEVSEPNGKSSEQKVGRLLSKGQRLQTKVLETKIPSRLVRRLWAFFRSGKFLLGHYIGILIPGLIWSCGLTGYCMMIEGWVTGRLGSWYSWTWPGDLVLEGRGSQGSSSLYHPGIQFTFIISKEELQVCNFFHRIYHNSFSGLLIYKEW